MYWKVLKPTVLAALFVLVVSVSVVGIRKSWIAAAANDEFVCGTVIGLQGQVADGLWMATVEADRAVLVPTRQAYGRLKLGKEFTFIYREGKLIAIANGHLCRR